MQSTRGQHNEGSSSGSCCHPYTLRSSNDASAQVAPLQPVPARFASVAAHSRLSSSFARVATRSLSLLYHSVTCFYIYSCWVEVNAQRRRKSNSHTGTDAFRGGSRPVTSYLLLRPVKLSGARFSVWPC